MRLRNSKCDQPSGDRDRAMTHTIEESQLAGSFKTLLAADTKDSKTLNAVLCINDEGDSWGVHFEVARKGETKTFWTLRGAIREYNRG